MAKMQHVAWVTSSVTLSFCNKSLMRDELDPILVIGVQMISSFAIASIAVVWQRSSVVNKEVLAWAVVVTPFYVTSLVLTMLMYRRLTLGSIVLIHNCRPLILFFAEALVFGERPSCDRVSALGLILCAGVLYVADMSDRKGSGDEFEMIDAWLALGATACWTTDLILARYMLQHRAESKLCNLGIVLVNNAAGFLLVGAHFIAAYAAPMESSARSSSAQWMPLLVLSCIAGFGMTYFTPALQRKLSATMFVILGIFAKALVVLCGAIIFHDAHRPVGILGLALSFVGSFVYARCEKREGRFETLETVQTGVSPHRLARLPLLFAVLAVALFVVTVAHNVWMDTYLVQVVPRARVRMCTTGHAEVVPRIVHATDRGNTPSRHTVRSVSDGFKLHYRNDSEAGRFVRDYCGDVYAAAFHCLLPGAFRADLYRMCALHAVGGIYMDSDLLALEPLDSIFSMCQPATIAWDRPSYTFLGVVAHAKKQMAFMAAAPAQPLFKCHMDTVVANVRRRLQPALDIAITGPVVFHDCFKRTRGDVAVSLVDQGYPWNTFARGPSPVDAADVVAYQIRHARRTSDYGAMVADGRVYSEHCTL